jgi:hypothetical protein
VRPLAVDLATFALPLLIGVGLFLLGRSFRRWPWSLRAAAVTLSVTMIAAGLLALTSAFPDNLRRVLFLAGGLTVLLCCVAMFLFGVVWAVPGRSMSSPFIGTLAVVALIVIGIESSGRLWWRVVSPGIWSRTTDEEGLLQQSSAVTCSPTAAVMLLHQVGITAGEGEIAYLAGTSVLGTDAEGIERALEAKAGPHGWRVEAGRKTYDECARAGGPFLAHVSGQYLGHAVLVVTLNAKDVHLIDPADGQRHELRREEFERDWDGMTVRLVR